MCLSPSLQTGVATKHAQMCVYTILTRQHSLHYNTLCWSKPQLHQKGLPSEVSCRCLLDFELSFQKRLEWKSPEWSQDGNLIMIWFPVVCGGVHFRFLSNQGRPCWAEKSHPRRRLVHITHSSHGLSFRRCLWVSCQTHSPGETVLDNGTGNQWPMSHSEARPNQAFLIRNYTAYRYTVHEAMRQQKKSSRFRPSQAVSTVISWCYLDLWNDSRAPPTRHGPAHGCRTLAVTGTHEVWSQISKSTSQEWISCKVSNLTEKHQRKKQQPTSSGTRVRRDEKCEYDLWCRNPSSTWATLHPTPW